ncbi:hypothetical protein RFI_11773 [Reticulomyxa filosa]|uniref:Uncharacterized protein n=1 Tax=Reticulomyxa filosa TaxID=46433 RepID=X6NI48_RETFI|nr:hypothetical protein RFI_11773 [Reticulomyxa filosa]|eukprot:ETO25369.1 hypothetical protein RFI_11773 [Reticulomyxa filosa]
MQPTFFLHIKISARLNMLIENFITKNFLIKICIKKNSGLCSSICHCSLICKATRECPSVKQEQSRAKTETLAFDMIYKKDRPDIDKRRRMASTVFCKVIINFALYRSIIHLSPFSFDYDIVIDTIINDLRKQPFQSKRKGSSLSKVMFLLTLVLTSLWALTITHGEVINCKTPGECKDKLLTCNSGQSCELICEAERSCEGVNYRIANREAKEVKVVLNGEWSGMDLSIRSIGAALPRDIIILSNNSNAANNLFISASKNDRVQVVCTAETSCKDAEIEAKKADSLRMQCNNVDACTGTEIYCPSYDNDCTVTCQDREGVCQFFKRLYFLRMCGSSHAFKRNFAHFFLLCIRVPMSLFATADRILLCGTKKDCQAQILFVKELMAVKEYQWFKCGEHFATQCLFKNNLDTNDWSCDACENIFDDVSEDQGILLQERSKT